MQRLLQLALDLFDPSTTSAGDFRVIDEPDRPTPRMKQGDDATKFVASTAPALPLGDAFEPVRHAHPRANREAVLDGHRVAYELSRVRRKTIGFVIAPEGLQVRAPRWVPQAEIDAGLREKARWILRKLHEGRQQRERHEAARIEWRDGAAFPFLGENVIVVLDPRQAVSGAGASLNTDAQALPGVSRLTLHVGLPQQAGPGQIRDAVQAWLMRQARRIFAERLDHFAPRLGVRWTRLSLSSAATRWGTASADGHIRLNWRLVHLAMPMIDYVVAHELAHLRVMDHSPRFWDTVASVMPDYAERRRTLREDRVPPW